MKTRSLEINRFNVVELSSQECNSITGGAHPLVAIAALGLGICVGVAIGALCVYGAYCLIKQLKH
ncbi:MAG: class IIb bacteriocin, lactobin A/cerein 7B family [Bacteroidota bacterium]|nr:class IIb bacteriocin, lactobin A/cerein 7B family [Cytophagales bacterium]